MGTLHAFANVVGELVRTTATAGRLVEVELRALPDSGSRARRSAQYSVVVRLPWLTQHDLQFVTQRGYVAAYTFKAVSLWLVKNLPGVACALSVKVPDATTMPAKWTPGRVNAQETRIAEINAGAIRAAAAEKAESVREWAESTRKHETLASARAMSEAASMLDVLRNGAAWPEPDATLQPGTTPPPPPPPAAPAWVPVEGGAGARVAPLHVLTGEAPEEVQETVVPEAATHVLAVSMQDDQGASFWCVDRPGGLQRLLYCSDAQAISYVRTNPSLFETLERAARPPVQDGQGRTIRYAVIRLRDGEIICRTDKTGGVFIDAQASGAVKYMALGVGGEIMGLAESAAGAGAAVRAYFGWLLPMRTAYYPAPGDVLRWVESDLVAHTETPRLLTYTGRAVVGLAGEALPVRPLVSVNTYSPGAARQATHAMLVPGTINGAKVYYLDDLLACDAPSDADAIQWAQNDADMWGRPYDALRRVLVRMSDGAALGERVKGEGDWLWGATAAGAAGRMVWAPATQSMPAQFIGTTRAGDSSGVADLVRTYWAVQPGEEVAYYTTPMGGGTSTPATVIGGAAAPEITPV